MVKIDDFHVEFVEKWALYHPGDTVHGRIHIKLNDNVLCDAVSAMFYGSARVFWVERQPVGAVTYSSENVYFNERHQIWCYEPSSPSSKKVDASKLAETRPHLARGSHVIEFTYTLPRDLPTSFEARHSVGCVRYFVKICVTNNEAIKHSRKAYFSVVKPFDLNLYPELYSSISKRGELLNRKVDPNALSCFPTVSKAARGDISVKLNVPKGGYVPGERIEFVADFVNDGTRSIRSVKAHLIQHVTVYANKPDFKMQSVRKEIVSVARTEKFPKGLPFAWNNTPVYIPAVVPTFDIDDVMEVGYTLRVDAYYSDTGKAFPVVSVEVPIIVGTVPLIANNTLGALPRGHEAPPAYDNYVAEIPPPTYEESVTTGTNNSENGDDLFLPRYAVYQIN